MVCIAQDLVSLGICPSLGMTEWEARRIAAVILVLLIQCHLEPCRMTTRCLLGVHMASQRECEEGGNVEGVSNGMATSSVAYSLPLYPIIFLVECYCNKGETLKSFGGGGVLIRVEGYNKEVEWSVAGVRAPLGVFTRED